MPDDISFTLYARPLERGYRCLLLPSPTSRWDRAKNYRFPPRNARLHLEDLKAGALKGVVVKAMADPGDGHRQPALDDLAALFAFGGLPAPEASENPGKGPSDPDVLADSVRGSDGFLLALIRAYQFPGDLADFAWSEDAAVMACLSHFVFESTGKAAGANLRIDEGGQSRTFPVDIKLGDSPSSAPMPLRITHVQRASGVFFKVDVSRARIAADELRLVLRRTVGAYASSLMPVIAEVIGARVDGSGLRSSEFDLADLMEPREYVGEQLQYRIEVLDAHGHVLQRARLELRRERLDPPIAVSAAEALLGLRVGPGPLLEIDLVWGEDASEDAASLELEVYAEERGLAECGFYGDDDDLALFEVLREADIDEGDEGGERVAHPAVSDAFARLAARNDRRGLRRVGRYPLPAADEEKIRRLVIPTAHEWLLPGRGYRLHVGLRRKGGTTECVSNLVACRHNLMRPSTGGEAVQRIEVFQLEVFSPEVIKGGYLLRSGGMSASVVEPDGAEGKNKIVRLAFSHVDDPAELVVFGPRATGSPGALPTGGYRVLVRDVVSAGDRANFTEAALVEVLPPLIAQYRPVRFEAAIPWAVERSGANNAFATHGDDLAERLGEALNLGLKTLETKLNLRRSAAALIVAANAGGAPKPDAMPAGEDPTAWPVIRPLIQVLEQRGWTLEVVVRADAPSTWPDLLLAAFSSVAELAGLKLLVARMADGTWMRTLRLVAVPSEKWCGDNNVSVAGKAFLEGPRCIVLRDLSVSPMVVALQQGRRVELELRPVKDLWHHDLEWAIQPLDRYDRARRLLNAAAAPDGPPTFQEVEDAERSIARRTLALADEGAREADARAGQSLRVPVSILRTQPVGEPVVVVPALERTATVVAFRLLDPRERAAAAGNALARTRSGRLAIQHLISATMPRAQDYQRLLPADWTEQAINEAVKDLPAEEQRPNPWRGFTAWTSDQAPLLLPAPGMDLVELKNVPYYFAYKLTAWMTADRMAGCASAIDTARSPGRIGLLRRPTVAVTREGADFKIVIELVPALLGSHLSSDEWLDLGGSEAKRPIHGLKDFDKSSPDIAVHLLADLEMEHTFYVNAGADDLAKLSPFVRLKVPQNAALQPSISFGFVAESSLPTVKAVAALNGARLTLTCSIAAANLDLAPALNLAVDAKAGSLSSRVYMALRRGRPSTRPFPLSVAG